MAGLKNNLYPPIIETYMPACLTDEPCKVYFSLSRYNSFDEIKKNVQVIINNQNTNLSELSSTKYPTGIMLTTASIDNLVVGDNKYYITIKPEDLQGGVFKNNQYYKVQIRFAASGVPAPSIEGNVQNIAGWLSEHQASFSEWSTVCLIRAISKPALLLRGFDGSSSAESTVFTSPAIDFIGSLTFADPQETEYLKNYNIKVINTLNNTQVFNSGVIYTNEFNPNEINYSLCSNIEDGITYAVDFTYVTNNMYSATRRLKFLVIQLGVDKLNATVRAYPDKKEARVKIHIFAKEGGEESFGNITIRRTSSKSLYTVWEDVHTVALAENKLLDYTWYDYTIESGVWYKYCAQKRNLYGDRGVVVIQEEAPFMLLFDDMFLTQNGMQLKIKFDPAISSYKHTMLESKVDTIGSKYPFIRRNGNVNYRQFPISGLITHWCDEDEVFLNRHTLLDGNEKEYNDYNQKNRIDRYNDQYYERKFREKITEFLYENSVKLFRSTTEGNILVKLMDISLTPNKTLGRMLYSFSATAYEVDEANLENYNKYNIQPLGNYDANIKFEFDTISQLESKECPVDIDLLSEVMTPHHNIMVDIGTVQTVQYLSWLRIEFDSEPYFIYSDNTFSADYYKDRGFAILGHLIYINDQPIVIPAGHVYELQGEGTEIYSLILKTPWPSKQEKVLIDYSAHILQQEDASDRAERVYYYYRPGQLWGTFSPDESLGKRIYAKYYYGDNNYYTRLLSINSINIEADPGTVLMIKTSADKEYTEHILNQPSLEVEDEEFIIEDFYFQGIRLSKDSTGQPRTTEFYYVEEPIYDNINSIEDAKANHVYRTTEGLKIYYKQNWYDFEGDPSRTKPVVVKCPIDAIIDYTYEMLKGEY